MCTETTILKINKALIRSFAVLDSWFDQPEYRLHRRPEEGKLSAAEILEHLMLANESLLTLVEKSNNDLKIHCVELPDIDPDIPEGIGLMNPFSDLLPASLEPKGITSLNEIRKTLRDQLYRCLCLLDWLDHKTHRGSEFAGRVVQHLWFAALYMKRHIIDYTENPVQESTY